MSIIGRAIYPQQHSRHALIRPVTTLPSFLSPATADTPWKTVSMYPAGAPSIIHKTGQSHPYLLICNDATCVCFLELIIATCSPCIGGPRLCLHPLWFIPMAVALKEPASHWRVPRSYEVPGNGILFVIFDI